MISWHMISSIVVNLDGLGDTGYSNSTVVTTSSTWFGIVSDWYWEFEGVGFNGSLFSYSSIVCSSTWCDRMIFGNSSFSSSSSSELLIHSIWS